MKFSIPLTIAALVLTTACGGSGGGNGSANAFAFSNFAQAEQKLSALESRADRVDQTAARNLPTSGNARYDGLLILATDSREIEGVIGTMQLNTNFASNRFSGSAGNFYTLDENRTSGRLTISNGRVRRNNDIQVTADVDGQVNFGAGNRTVNAEAVGAFGGNRAQFSIGVIEGTARGGGQTDDVAGVWVAERQ